MGCGPYSNKNCRSCTSTSSTANAPNPNPGRFKIERIDVYGKNLVVQVEYLDCTNFEGRKICLYLNTTKDQILQSASLDPHFSKGGLSPFARFKPTNEGLYAARELAKNM